MHLRCVQCKYVHKVIHAINITAYFRLRHNLKAGTNSLSLFRSWPFSGWSDGTRVRCPQLYPTLWPQSRILGALFKLLIHSLAGVVVHNLSV